MSLSLDLPLYSAIDDSVNFVGRAADQPGFFEARYVRRHDSEIIVYLSAQTGCRQACRFCHLTQTGQTSYVDASVDELLIQAETVLGHYHSQEPASVVNYNFMARGEPLASEVILAEGDNLLHRLGLLAAEHGLSSRPKISTIMPSTMKDRELLDVFSIHRPDIYLSVYSMDKKWRRRWLPKALDVEESLAKLVHWQQNTRKIPVLHWALINHEDGGNDSDADAAAIALAVEKSGLLCDVNLVRYNPANSRLGQEPSEEHLAAYTQALQNALPAGCNVRHVNRVGFDVAASCGMFVSKM